MIVKQKEAIQDLEYDDAKEGNADTRDCEDRNSCADATVFFKELKASDCVVVNVPGFWGFSMRSSALSCSAISETFGLNR